MGGLKATDLVIPDDRERVARSIADNRLSAYRATGLRKDGTTFDVDITGTAIMHKGSPARVTVIRDITHWRRLDRLKNEFVSTVSHELRTPLTSIRGSLGLLEGGAVGVLSPQGLDLVRIARGNSERLIRLINDMLDLDKIEAGKLELRPTTLMPADVMRSAMDGIRPMAEQFKMRLVEHVVAHRTFPGDRDRVVQVLTNLISNAIKFSPEGSTVEVSAIEIGTLPAAVEDAAVAPLPDGRLALLGGKTVQSLPNRCALHRERDFTPGVGRRADGLQLRLELAFLALVGPTPPQSVDRPVANGGAEPGAAVVA